MVIGGQGGVEGLGFAWEGRRRDGFGGEGVACLLLGFFVFGDGTSSGLIKSVVNKTTDKTSLSL